MKNLLYFAIWVCIFSNGLTLNGQINENIENVVVDDENIVYRLIVKNDSLVGVKKEYNAVFRATQHDTKVMPVTYYGDHITVDKVKLSGAKPIYRSWEDDDLFYTGSKICAMPLELKKGKSSKLSYEQTYVSPAQFGTVMLSSIYPTKHYSLTIFVPTPLVGRIKIHPFNLPSGINVQTRDVAEGQEYFLEWNNRPKYRHERFSQSINAPQLEVSGVFSGTKGVYDYLRSYLSPLSADNSAPAELAREIAANFDSKREAVDSIVSWVRQNIRYIAVEHGEYGLKPADPVAVFESRYGDCKGSATLITDMLRHIGLDARRTWIGTRGNSLAQWDEIPSLSCGNHMISTLFFDNDTIFLDGTTAWSPKHYVVPSIRGSLALIENGNDYILARVPDTDKVQDVEHLKGKFKVEDNKLVSELEFTLSGLAKMNYVNKIVSADARLRDNIIKSYLTYPRNNAEVKESYQIVGAPSDSTCTIRGIVEDATAIKKIGDRLILDINPIRMDFELLKTENRTRDAFLPTAFGGVYEFEVALPEGYEAVIPKSEAFTYKWYDVAVDYKVENGVLYCNARITPLQSEVSLAEVDAYNEAVKTLKRIATQKIVLKQISNQ